MCDAIESSVSLGEEDDLLEIMDALTEEEHFSDVVKGYLTSEEVFNRFKYCYYNNTRIFKDED